MHFTGALARKGKRDRLAADSGFRNDGDVFAARDSFTRYGAAAQGK